MIRSALIASLFVAGAAGAQDAETPEQGDAILVLDASGSMWGQIDGEPKIVIAREVISGLLDDLPAERRLGLIAYGHNRKGDCADIETLVEVGGDRDAIGEAVDALNPKGMTPLTDSVVRAAEALRSTERKATVILVSDGEETCDADPCAAAETLERTGVDFTAHVVGFDLGAAGEEAAAQLQCLAENTGGRFLTADNAAELNEALQQVSQAEPEPPATAEVSLAATDMEGGPVIGSGLVWTITHGATGEPIFESEETGRATAEIPPGVHDVRVVRVSDGATAEGELDAPPSGASLTLAIVTEVEASLDAPETAPAGDTIRVVWEGPGEEDDYILVGPPGGGADDYANYTRTRRGNPLNLLMPAEAGEYELRYVLEKNDSVLARRAITATAIEASVSAPETAPAGSTVEVDWDGPDYDDDYVTVVEAGADDGAYINYQRTRRGDPLDLKMPPQAGEYEIRYVQDQGDRTLASQPITLTEVTASLDAPDTAVAGQRVEVAWEGPDYDDDYVTVVEAGADEGAYLNYERTRRGDPLDLRLPIEPGDYELRYVMDQGDRVLARSAITAEPVEATVSVDGPATAGADFEVAWTGPDYDDDYITVARPDQAEGGQYVNYTRTRRGSPLELRAPEEPGEYEVRYVVDQGDVILARARVTVQAAEEE